ncbi:hypothetical protein CGZ80_03025 [Rhodopirellula sp. MGV]|nr:hypothetical protein CGZ80_03025 [Rhodopirellula sp. MGV]PNY38545.1 hypothetical protein C2E31_01070 [Rhodopirellula baltica]
MNRLVVIALLPFLIVGNALAHSHHDHFGDGKQSERPHVHFHGHDHGAHRNHEGHNAVTHSHHEKSSTTHAKQHGAADRDSLVSVDHSAEIAYFPASTENGLLCPQLIETLPLCDRAVAEDDSFPERNSSGSRSELSMRVTGARTLFLLHSSLRL